MAYSVLIADDEPLIRMDVADLLRKNGFSIAGEAGDGFDAVMLAEKLHPDVVLMDINMPVFDGLTAAKEILEKGFAETVILLTAYCDAQFVERAKEAGVGGYLVKPIQTNALLPAIEIAMAQSRRFAEVRQREAAALKKAQDQQLVHRAKAVLAAHLGISEPEALARMQKESMNKRCSLVFYAQRILDAYVDDDTVRQAKEKLMKRYGISERSAYKRIRELSEKQNETVYDTARKLLFPDQKM